MRHRISAGPCHLRRGLAIRSIFVTVLSSYLTPVLTLSTLGAAQSGALTPVEASAAAQSTVGTPPGVPPTPAPGQTRAGTLNNGYQPLRSRIYSVVIGKETLHRIQPGDTLAALARRYRVSAKVAQRQNAIRDPRRLRIGQKLVLSNQHIVPAPFSDGLVVDLDLLRLFVVREGQAHEAYPIAAGRPAWETPAGIYRIVGRRKSPTWFVPPSIQREMQALGQPVRQKVPPGLDNPLGPFWIQLSAPGIGIHGTNAPWSVGRYSTHGCIRLHNEDVERLFYQVPDGTPVAIVREPVRLARTVEGRVFLEVHDHPRVWSVEFLLNRLEAHGLLDYVDWDRARTTLAGRWGVAVDISRRDPSAPP